MLPVKTNDIEVKGTLGGEKVAMGISLADVSFIMGVLTDLYSDPELAVIREYSTNALDAQIEAGITRPIEVTTPSSLSPYFKVQDFGVGMSVDDITRIYSQYGASTKRETNEQVGMLGLGSKSALTYTNQFMVTSVKGGVKIIVSVSRQEDGSASMEIVDTKATNEPSGTTITIPVQRHNSFDVKSANFFRFWKEGTVLVNGKAPTRIEGTKVGDNITVVQNLDADYIVMGNVAYNVGRKLHEGGSYYRYFGIVAEVPIGSISFTPSREALYYNSTTNNTIEAVKTQFTEGITKAIVDDIASADSHGEALQRYLAWPAPLVQAAGDITYEGQSIPKMFKGDFWVFESNRTRFGTTNHSEIDHRTIQKAVIITGFKASQVTSRHKSKIRAWAEDESLTQRTFLLTENPIGSPWLDTHPQGTWAEVAAMDIDGPKVPGEKRLRAKFDVWDGSYFNESNTFDTTKDIVFIGPREGIDTGHLRRVGSMLNNVTLIQLGKNRWDKFKRDFEGAVHLRTYLRDKVQGEINALTAEDAMSMKVPTLDRTIAGIDVASVEDKEVRDYLTTVSKLDVDTPTMKRYNGGINAANAFGISYTVPKHEVPKSPITSQRFPLLTSSSYYNLNKKHALIYINAVTAAESKEK